MRRRRVLLLLALLPWMIVSHGKPRLPHDVGGDRVLVAASAEDVATSLRGRVEDGRDLLRSIAAAGRPENAPAPHASAAGSDTEADHSRLRPREWRRYSWAPVGWRGFQSRRLAIPHEANAPPIRQS